MAKKKRAAWMAIYRAREDQVRTVLDKRTSSGTTIHPEDLAKERLDGITCQVSLLERRYERERNPVDVLEALTLLFSKTQITGEPLVLPHWVLAYLVSAAEFIIAGAVARPEKPQAGSNKGRKIKKLYPTASRNQSRRFYHLLQRLVWRVHTCGTPATCQ